MVDLIPATSFPYLNFQEFVPAPRLRPWVQCIWSIGGDCGFSYSKDEKFYPDAGSSLTIELSPAWPLVSFLHNKSTRFQLFSSDETCISIRFNPTGAYCLLGLEPEQFVDDFYRLGEDLTPPWYESLMSVAHRLYHVRPEQRAEHLESWLLSLLETRATLDTPTRNIILAIRNEPLPLRELEGRLGLTRRTLERKFKQEVGVSPGQFVGYCRIHKARRLLLATATSLADIALQCGYFDQAHFSNSFQQFTYESPAAYRRRKMSQIYKA